jgi:hypothetical protein
MIVKLSIVTSISVLIEARDESAGLMFEFLYIDDNLCALSTCLGFNDQLGFKMQYHPDERDVYDNVIMLKKEI